MSHRPDGCQASDLSSRLRFNISKRDTSAYFLKKPQDNLQQRLWRQDTGIFDQKLGLLALLVAAKPGVFDETSGHLQVWLPKQVLKAKTRTSLTITTWF